MTKLLLLCELPEAGGGDFSMLATLDRVQLAGFEPTIVAPDGGNLAPMIRAKGIRHLPLESYKATGEREPLETIREKLALILRAEQPDLVHANSLSMSRIAGPLTRELGLVSLGHIRDIVKLSRKAMDDVGLHDRILCVSQATRDWHVDLGLDAEKTHVLFNGVDLDRFKPSRPTGSLHRELGIDPNVPLIATIGQISLRKGQSVLLEALQTLALEGRGFHLLIIGECFGRKRETQELGESLEAASHAGPLAGRLHLLGTRDDIDVCLREITMLAHPARQEPLGRVLLESAASGAPVITTDVGGTREIFPEPNQAILIPPDQPATLSDAIATLLDDPNLCKSIAQAARKRAETAFDISLASENLIAHYRELLGRCQY